MAVDDHLESGYEDRFFIEDVPHPDDGIEFHDTGVAFFHGGRVQASCECGWEGPERDIGTGQAHDDATEHRKEMGIDE